MNKNEQTFLREELRNRYYLNTGQQLNLTQHVPSFGPLFDDIVRCLNISKSDISEKEDPKDGKSFTIKAGSEEELSCSWRVLRDFFHIDKTKTDKSAIETYYAYLSNNELSREEFIQKIPDFFIDISENECHFLRNKIWKKVQNYPSENNENIEIDTDSPSDNRYILDQVSAKIDKNKSDININVDALISFFEDITRKDWELSATTVNALYYYISDNEHNRNQFLLDNPATFTANTEKEKLSGEVKPRQSWVERPEIALWLFFISIGGMVFLFLVQDNVTPLLNVFTFVFAFLFLLSSSWFLLLRNQAQKEVTGSMINSNRLNNFWFWWFNKLPMRRIILSKSKVKIVVVHDNSFEIQRPLATIKEKFHIVSVSEIDCSKYNIDQVKQNLYESKADGLYFFLTENIWRWGVVEIIDDWSAKFDDIPIVYVDYIDLTLRYGKVLSQNAGTGLWQLLSQALKRTGAWRNQSEIFRNYSRFFSLILASVCLIFLLTGLVEHYKGKNWKKELSREISKNQANKEQKQHLLSRVLLYERDSLLRKYGYANDNNLNLSAFRPNQDGDTLKQIARTDYKSDLVGFKFPSDVGVATCSFDPDDGYNSALYIKGWGSVDSLGNNWPVYDLTRNEADTISSNYGYAQDSITAREKEIQGIMCITQKDDEHSITLCLEILAEEELKDTFLIKDRKVVLDFMAQLSETLLTWEKDGELGDFPEPKRIY